MKEEKIKQLEKWIEKLRTQWLETAPEKRIGIYLQAKALKAALEILQGKR